METTDLDKNDFLEHLKNEPVAREFRPYVDSEAGPDAVNVYFKDEADYSKRLTDKVTLFLSVETDEIVGCRIKGISALVEDLPNFIDVKHGGAHLSIIFWAFRGGATDEGVRKALNELGKLSRQAADLRLVQA